MSLVAATRTIATADREEVARAARATAEAKTTSEPAEKPGAVARPAAPRLAVTASCQQAVNNLNALRQADVAEDATERTGQPKTETAIAADRIEDAADVQNWRAALMAARAACIPQAPAACAAEISGLQGVVQTTGAAELAELQAATRDKSDQVADWIRIRAAFSSVAIACAVHE